MSMEQPVQQHWKDGKFVRDQKEIDSLREKQTGVTVKFISEPFVDYKTTSAGAYVGPALGVKTASPNLRSKFQQSNIPNENVNRENTMQTVSMVQGKDIVANSRNLGQNYSQTSSQNRAMFDKMIAHNHKMGHVEPEHQRLEFGQPRRHQSVDRSLLRTNAQTIVTSARSDRVLNSGASVKNTPNTMNRESFKWIQPTPMQSL